MTYIFLSLFTLTSIIFNFEYKQDKATTPQELIKGKWINKKLHYIVYNKDGSKFQDKIVDLNDPAEFDGQNATTVHPNGTRVEGKYRIYTKSSKNFIEITFSNKFTHTAELLSISKSEMVLSVVKDNYELNGIKYRREDYFDFVRM